MEGYWILYTRIPVFIVMQCIFMISDCKKYETIIIPSGYLNAFGFQILEEKNIVMFSLFTHFLRG